MHTHIYYQSQETETYSIHIKMTSRSFARDKLSVSTKIQHLNHEYECNNEVISRLEMNKYAEFSKNEMQTIYMN